MTSRPARRAARAAGHILLAGTVGGLVLTGGALLALVLLARGLVVPASIGAVGFLAAGLLVRAGVLAAAGDRSAQQTPHGATGGALARPDATLPLRPVPTGPARSYGPRNSFANTSGVA